MVVSTETLRHVLSRRPHINNFLSTVPMHSYPLRSRALLHRANCKNQMGCLWAADYDLLLVVFRDSFDSSKLCSHRRMLTMNFNYVWHTRYNNRTCRDSRRDQSMSIIDVPLRHSKHVRVVPWLRSVTFTEWQIALDPLKSVILVSIAAKLCLSWGTHWNLWYLVQFRKACTWIFNAVFLREYYLSGRKS